MKLLRFSIFILLFHDLRQNNDLIKSEICLQISQSFHEERRDMRIIQYSIADRRKLIKVVVKKNEKIFKEDIQSSMNLTKMLINVMKSL